MWDSGADAMTNDIEERIREVAYMMWESAGRQYGMAVDYWLQAEQEVMRTVTAATQSAMSTAAAAATAATTMATEAASSVAQTTAKAAEAASSTTETAASGTTAPGTEAPKPKARGGRTKVAT